MSAVEWAPGDVPVVAVVTWENASGVEREAGNLRVTSRLGSRVDDWWLFDRTSRIAVDSETIREIRPLVVIDPEDREQVERLAASLRTWIEGVLRVSVNDYDLDRIADKVQAALRSLVEPPEPPEPLGLGAVVEDDKGAMYVRHVGTLAPWYAAAVGPQNRPWRYYSDLNIVRVLSEGVTP